MGTNLQKRKPSPSTERCFYSSEIDPRTLSCITWKLLVAKPLLYVYSTQVIVKFTKILRYLKRIPGVYVFTIQTQGGIPHILKSKQQDACMYYLHVFVYV